MKYKICVFLLFIIFFYNSYAQENDFSSLISFKVIALSPVGLSFQVNPIKPVGFQISYQHSVWSDSWRATADLKIYPDWIIEEDIMANLYLGPYFRYKDVELFNIYKGDYQGYLQSFYAGLVGGGEAYYKFLNIDFIAGLGLSTDKYIYQTGFQYIDIRAGLSIGIHYKGRK